MPRKAPSIIIEEKPGDRYPDLETAQGAALPLVSADLHAVIRDLLERGILVNKNGMIDVPEEEQP
jgi:hypothetical protein